MNGQGPVSVGLESGCWMKTSLSGAVKLMSSRGGGRNYEKNTHTQKAVCSGHHPAPRCYCVNVRFNQTASEGLLCGELLLGPAAGL